MQGDNFTFKKAKLEFHHICNQEQGRRKPLGSGAATANQNTAGGRALVGVQGAKPPKAPRISRFRNPKMVMLFEYL